MFHHFTLRFCGFPFVEIKDISSTPLYKQPHAYFQTHSIQAFSPLHSKSSILLQDPMAEKEIIVFGVDFNKNPPKEDSLAIVPVEEALSFAIVHPKEVVPMPPKKTYGQSYYAQARQYTLPAPQEHLLLKDAPKGPMVAVSKNTKLLPP
jgi:hypothetical protein